MSLALIFWLCRWTFLWIKLKNVAICICSDRTGLADMNPTLLNGGQWVSEMPNQSTKCKHHRPKDKSSMWLAKKMKRKHPDLTSMKVGLKLGYKVYINDATLQFHVCTEASTMNISAGGWYQDDSRISVISRKVLFFGGKKRGFPSPLGVCQRLGVYLCYEITSGLVQFCDKSKSIGTLNLRHFGLCWHYNNLESSQSRWQIYISTI